MTRELHKALRSSDPMGDGLDMYEVYQKNVESTPVTVLRDCLRIESDREPIDIDEVEPIEAIMKRFCTGGMSLGALSREAHETLAMGVNRAGARSNSGQELCAPCLCPRPHPAWLMPREKSLSGNPP